MPHPYLTRVIAGQLSRITRYYDAVVQFAPLPHDDGSLLKHVDCATKATAHRVDELPAADVAAGVRTAVLLNANLNSDLDIEGTLANVKSRLNRLSRVVVVMYNPYFRGVFWLVTRLGLRTGPLPSTFVTRDALSALAALSGYEIVQIKPVGYVPFSLLGLGDLINRALPAVPLLRWLGVAAVVVLRPVMPSGPPSLTIVIPCRNEKGNIEAALTRLPAWPAPVEVIFVEGHSAPAHALCPSANRKGKIRRGPPRLLKGVARAHHHSRCRSDDAAGDAAAFLQCVLRRAGRLRQRHAPGVSDGR
jgi:hypothetical protein